MNRARVLIVDDEPLARDCVRLALAGFDDCEVVGECPDGESAIGAIRTLVPDLVFLDVQMPGVDAFGVIEEIGPAAMPAIVFVTAFDRHAIRAFEIHAVDYILKPFDDERFGVAVRHALDRLRAERVDALTARLEALLGSRTKEPRTLRRLAVRDRDRIRYVAVEDVDWFEAEGNYVRIHRGGETHLIRNTLTGLMDRLDPSRFVRIHRSTVVNVDRVVEVQPWAGGDYIAILHDKRTLKVSRNYRDGLLGPEV
jgi:two-component system, LytTR family, response regulator